MPKLHNMFPSKWLAAADLEDQDKTLTISDVTQEIVGQGEESESKWVLYFNEVEKGLVLNKTNATSLAAALGDETDYWLGRKVVLYPTEVQFNSKMVEAIRVKEKATKNANKTPTAPAKSSGALAAKASKPAEPLTQEEADEADIPF